jgi:hypothetical protein
MHHDHKRPVHLVGSVSLASAADVFEAVGGCLGDHIARMPDGETGPRAVPFPFRPALIENVTKTPGIAFIRDFEIIPGMSLPLYGLAPGANVDDVQFGALGFAAAAKDSYRDFVRLRAAGKVPVGMRMQACIPTPFMLALCFTVPEQLVTLWPAYERAMVREMEDMLKEIPGEELAIQWDMSPEFHEVLEGRNVEAARHVTRDMLVSAVARITDAVPLAVETGWHFCYGDAGHYEDDHETFHITEPKDMAMMVDFANDVCAATQRPVQWVHMPVPRERDDSAYFAPLARLQLKPGQQLFLGLVHKYDGIEGAKRRIDAASQFYPDFGVGTECGMGRRPAAEIPGLLALQSQIAATL